MNLPNAITIARIALIPLLIIACEKGWFQPGWSLPIAFAVLGFSDMLDGYLARKNNQITELGKLLDPVADKILVLASLLILMEMPEYDHTAKYRIPGWSVLIIMAREFAVSGLRSLIAAHGGEILAASWMGKVKTTLQMVAIGMLFFRGDEPITGLPLMPLGWITYWAALLITLYSGLEYFWKNRAVLRER